MNYLINEKIIPWNTSIRSSYLQRHDVYRAAFTSIFKSTDQTHTHSDASYLSESEARSCATGHFFLSSMDTHANNGPIHTVCTIIKNVISSAPEAEIAACFLTAKDAVPIRNELQEMGHPQPPTPSKPTIAPPMGSSMKQ